LVNKGTVKPSLVVTHDAQSILAVGDLSIDMDVTLACTEAGSFESMTAKLAASETTNKGSWLATDALVNTTSAGQLKFSFTTKWTGIEFGVQKLNSTSPQDFCTNCLPSSSTFGSITSTGFEEQPSFELQLSPSFWLAGIPNNLFYSFQFQSNYAFTPANAELPEFSTSACKGGKTPLRQTISQVVAALVSTKSQIGSVSSLSPRGPDGFTDCSAIQTK
jgi:hypothetical protein